MPNRQFKEYDDFKVYKSFEGMNLPEHDAVDEDEQQGEQHLERLITSDIELSQIKRFICDEQYTRMTFYSSPYQ